MALPLNRPPGWETPKLTGYLESLWANSIAVFANKEEAHRVCRIDDVMAEISENWKPVSPTVETIVPLMMFFRSHSAFRSAAALGFGGALVEGMAVLRLSLEFAGYAALIADDPMLARSWFDRDTDKKAKQRVRDEFHGGRIKAALTKLDPKVVGGLQRIIRAPDPIWRPPQRKIHHRKPDDRGGGRNDEAQSGLPARRRNRP